MDVRIVEISGTPYERGVQYGKQAKDLIDICVDNYKRYVSGDTGMDWDTACRVASGYKKAIEAYRPDYLEEMRGIADGSGRSFADILTINCRSEIRAMTGYVPAECTAVAVLPSASADGHTYTGQNWDNQTLQQKCMVVVKIRRTEGPDVMLITEAGFVGGKGMNSNGVSLMLNALFVGYEKDAVPLHIKMRAALDSDNISEAYSNAAKGNTGTGGNLLLGSEGAAIAEELTLHEVDGVLPENGILTHTNHILSPRLQHIPDNFRRDGSTFLRLCRADELLRSKKALTKEDIMAMFSDETGYPLGLYTYPIETVPEEKQYSTNYTVVFDNTEKTVYLRAASNSLDDFKAITI